MQTQVHSQSHVAALAAVGPLDTPPEAFDGIVGLVAHALDADIALLSLLDGDRQFFSSASGPAGPVADAREAPLAHSFCRCVVETGAPLVVADARDGGRLAAQPGLQDLGVVAYVGVPLQTDVGHVLGALCAIDHAPRAWRADELDRLRELAAIVAREIESRKAVREARDLQRRLEEEHTGLTSSRRGAAMLESALDCIITMDGNGRVIDFNPAAERTFGYTRTEATGRELAELIVPPALRDAHRHGLARHLATREAKVLGRRVELTAVRADGTELPVELTITRSDLPDGPLFTGSLRDLTERRRAEDALKEAEQRFRTLVEQVPTVTYICDYDEAATHRYISPQAEALTGYPASRWIEDPGHWQRILHPDDRRRVVEQIAHCVREQIPFDCEYRMVRADGETIIVWDRETIVRDAHGEPVTSQGVLVDMTDLRRAETALTDSEHLNRAVVEALDEGVVVLDGAMNVLSSNASAVRLLGPDPSELVHASSLSEPISFGDGTPLDRAVGPGRSVMSSGRTLRDVLLRVARPDGDERWISANYTSLGADPAGEARGVVISFADVTDRRRTQETIARLAYHDQLTGLPNRAQLNQQLPSALARARRTGRAAAVLSLDVDRFKTVNDSLGHAAGDDLLRQIAERLAGRTRAGDLLLRNGGDEFMVLLFDLGGDARDIAHRVATDLVAALEAPFVVNGLEFELGASVGIALYPPDGEGPAELLKRADAALYAVKRTGRGRAGFYEPTSDDADARLTFSSRLRRGLARDEFELHYQPVFSLADDRAVGVEALIRWRDPERGLISPGEFIPLAEEAGLIETIGDWVIDATLAQTESWARMGLHPPVALNVSPRQLRQPGFAARVAAKLADWSVAPEQISIEITESAAMEDPKRVRSTMEDLHRLGVLLAIDDFGSGFSSLSRLRTLPVETLKIDRSFLRGVPESADAAAIVSAVVALAEALGMRAVAEGVETAAQRAFLEA